MATDTRTDRFVTLADLCQAIADGNLPYAVRDENYHIKTSDVRRMRAARPPRHDISSPDFLIEPDTATSSLNAGCSA